MTTTIRAKGTVNEMKELFDNSNKLSIRSYDALTNKEITDEDLNKDYRFEIIIRHKEDLESQILSCKKISKLLELNDGLVDDMV